MNCHRCGKPLEDGAQFCEECGAPVEFPQQPPIPGQVVPEKAAAQDNTMKKIALVLGAVCVALVVAVVLLLVFRMRNNAGKSGESAAVQTVSVTEVTAGETTNEAATEAVAAVAETTAAQVAEAPATEAPTQAPAETTAVKRTADYSLYLRAVKQFVLSGQLVYREYYLYDIDRDGVNELIVQYGTCEADAIYAFWRIDDSGTGIEKLEESAGGHSYLCSQDGVLYTNLGHMGYQSVSAAELVKENGVWKINWREVFTQETCRMWRITPTSARHCRAMIWRTPHRWAEATTPRVRQQQRAAVHTPSTTNWEPWTVIRALFPAIPPIMSAMAGRRTRYGRASAMAGT